MISPIGPEGSDVREHADDVFDFIIKPAIEECNVSAYRADQLRDPGRITDQMFNSILQEDFCIAVLTGHNPNVFYEVAVAQTAGKPVIILMQKKQELPFDIKDLRCVYYDLKPRPLQRGDYKRELVDHIRSLERRQWREVSLLARYGRGIEGDINEEWSFIPSAAKYSEGGWSRLVSGAKQYLDMMGISLAGWKKTRGFGDQLVQLASTGCRVRILLMDPDSESLQHRINPELEDLTPGPIINTITACCDYYQKIAAQAEEIELRTVTNGTINLYVIRNEAEGIAVPYLYSERSAESPLWRCRQGTRLYEILENEFEALWSKNEPPRIAGA
ncbi:DUF5919 domain-containing protein [Acidobacteriota bacterium]